jgi:uncharacterized protein (DUF1810 family)
VVRFSPGRWSRAEPDVQEVRHLVPGRSPAYLGHTLLGPRLVECASVLTEIGDRSAEQIFGPVDAQKLRSSMTLFLRADPGANIFEQVLDEYFEGIADPATDTCL